MPPVKCLPIALVLSACMVGPPDGMIVSSTTAAVSFLGADPEPNVNVEIQALSPRTGWTPIDTATSASGRNEVWDDVPIHYWNASVVVPHWQPGTTGSVATIRARRPDGRMLYTFKPGWGECRGRYPKLGNFMSSCTSSHSPELFLYTADFPTSTDLSITQIRRSFRGIAVTVRNGGRHGRVIGMVCRLFGNTVTSAERRSMAPATMQIYELSLVPARGQTVTCDVSGINEDGTPETLTSNNSLVRAVL